MKLTSVISALLIFISVLVLSLYLMWLSLVLAASVTSGQIRVGARVVHGTRCISDLDGQGWYCEKF